jgi:hypothetical protein
MYVVLICGYAWPTIVGMHIHIVPNRGSPPTVLLRESYRQGGKVSKRTLANLSSLSEGVSEINASCVEPCRMDRRTG